MMTLNGTPTPPPLGSLSSVSGDTGATSSSSGDSALLQAILAELKSMKQSHSQLEQRLEALSLAAPASPLSLGAIHHHHSNTSNVSLSNIPFLPLESTSPSSTTSYLASAPNINASPSILPRTSSSSSSPYTQRVILTTYPNQVGIHPIPLKWGAKSAEERGPVIASRHKNSIKVRNAIGAYAGCYSIYRALACAQGLIDPNHRPDYTNTEPPVDIEWNPNWDDKSKIVTIDPYGHLAPQVFKSHYDAGLDIRPTISITKAHIKLIDMDEAVKCGSLQVDGKIVVRTPTEWINANRAQSAMAKTERVMGDEAAKHFEHAAFDAGVELNVNKVALDPVWYLPGVAERLGITEIALRRALFEETGGSASELITRPDLKVFLPPIGGMTVYIFGPIEYISDETKECTVRVHDQCSGSDVFGSDICTCRPYLIFGMEEAVKCAQRGGVGIVVYFQKEGRALGEVTKYLVYNARKRGGDRADHYFKRTEDIAGVKDMRFQALMPDVLLWLGVKKIDNMISMSDMKHDAIVNAGIPILKRYEIPEELIPPDSRVEIDAKIAAGYFSTTTVKNLELTHGRAWEDIVH